MAKHFAEFITRAVFICFTFLQVTAYTMCVWVFVHPKAYVSGLEGRGGEGSPAVGRREDILVQEHFAVWAFPPV